MAADAAFIPCRYELDAARRLTAVDAEWARFALANGAPDLVPPAPLGRSVLDFISDSTTKLLYAEIFRRAEHHGRPLNVNLRCDSPALRRFLTLTITPHADGFHMQSTATRLEPRPHQALLDASAHRGGPMLRLCSWCKRLDADGRWCDVEEGVVRLGLFQQESMPPVTHAMCEDCYVVINRTLDQYGS